jgi:MFS-type transporter involved in bile tolerance (Atg22 family)
MLVALSPPETIGEFLRLFSLTEKVSAGVGPALTAAMLFIFGGGAVGYRISLGSLAAIIAAGLFFSSVSPTPSRRQGRRVRPLDSPAS